MKKYKITYWIATSIIALLIGLGSFGDMFMIEPIKESMIGLGFPFYILPFFGVTKVAAVVVLLVPAFKHFKEVAYGGLFFYFLGAIYCHLFVGDPFGRTWSALVVLIIVVLSYLIWRKLENDQVRDSFKIVL
jgi:hypothetical protein